ncbi:MAG: hypothetical protein EA377_03490 [Phycisphaerales bacterium]|nr:MAG: hypothetical protein EA377_03490 [Phycisphaerales bacterium]
MSEQRFRLCAIILLMVFISGVLIIGNRLANQLAHSAEQLVQSAEQRAQNGRYTQFDLAKASRPAGASTVHLYESWVVDTRTGEVLSGVTPNSPRDHVARQQATERLEARNR